MREKTFTPIGDRVLVEPVEATRPTDSLIQIPEGIKEPSVEGIVRSLGTGRRTKSGARIPFEVKNGDRVLYSQFAGGLVRLSGKDYRLLETNLLLAVFTHEN